jgi:bifunctional non-homologous end joining protein LigD
MARAEPRAIVAGVGISHPGRIVFPTTGATKLDVARYYEAIAPWVLPHLADRPLTLVRCPNGVAAGAAKRGPDCFYMKHSNVWAAPEGIRRVNIQEKTKIGEYVVVDSLSALVGLVQMNVLEMHTWNSRAADIERPDRIVMDLDPGAEVGWRAVVAAAKVVRGLFAALDLESFVKTTGGRGLHVVVPLVPRADWAECLAFARAFALALVRQRPDTFTERFAKTGRSDKILLDYLRNNRTNTSIAAYSTRARPNAPVSVPLTWTELGRLATPDRFTMASVLPRLARMRTDPWKTYRATRQRLPRGAVRALEAM